MLKNTCGSQATFVHPRANREKASVLRLSVIAYIGFDSLSSLVTTTLGNDLSLAGFSFFQIALP
jgi:hypothetical protein